MLMPRRGFTLTELIVAMVMLGLVLTGLTTVIMQQQRFYGGTAEVLETRANVRQVADILPSELRPVSPANGDLYAISASSIDYRASIGASVVCTITNARTRITLPPLSTAAQNGATAWLTAPQLGDSLMIYDQSGNAGAADDVWRVHVLTLAPVTDNSCNLFVAGPLEAANGFRIEVSPALSATIMPGAAIRFFRRSRYELYNGADGQGYLGFSDCLATRSPACTTPQPVSGPYLPLGNNPPGITFTFFAPNNTATNMPTEVARIDVVARSRTRSSIKMAGYQAGRYTDSLTFSIAARN